MYSLTDMVTIQSLRSYDVVCWKCASLASLSLAVYEPRLSSVSSLVESCGGDAYVLSTITIPESCGVADLITTCLGGRNRKVSEAFVTAGKVRISKDWQLLERKRCSNASVPNHIVYWGIRKGNAQWSKVARYYYRQGGLWISWGSRHDRWVPVDDNRVSNYILRRGSRDHCSRYLIF